METLVIIGTGPAGLTAALYAARAQLEPLVLAGSVPGGQLTQTTEVENYPGFPEGIQGFDLMEALQRQAERFGARLQNAIVTAVDFKPGGPQRLTLSDDSTLETKAVIIATGARPRWLGLPSEDALRNKGVSSCATCDGAFFRGVPIVVVGGGDSALEEALFLTRFGSKVMVVHRRDALRASKVMIQRAEENPKIEFIWNSVVTDVLDVTQDKVTGVVLKDVKTGAESRRECGAVFVAIGHIPNTEPFESQVQTEGGYIVLPDPGRSQTSVEGVFAAGDCADHVYRQAVTAAGMGCRAAIDAERWLIQKGL
ncbi:MAG: thioredoxin-disulfide reductase [Lentisphaerae bacterium]|nr:thioredoxin-disulfide reductase [Lentisphaerota bacterium]